MELIKIAALISKFGADVVLVAVLVYILTFVLKKTLLKKLPKKYLTFVPFLLGIVLYSLFSMLVTLSVQPIISNFPHLLQRGVATGSAATVIHIVYEQFIRGETISQSGVREQYIARILGALLSDVPQNLVQKISALSEKDEIICQLKTELPQLSDSEIENLYNLLSKML